MAPMKLRRAKDRGYADHGWLRSFHTFSFADYYDPANMGFRSLRVINEDRVAPAKGFGTHSHKDMEIISYVLGGALQHKDSMGTGSIIRPGDVQKMSAGIGVAHSEFNASKDEAVHFLQIWIVPERRGLLPEYEQKNFPEAERRGKLRLVASHDGREGSILIHQDVSLYATILGEGDAVTHALGKGRAAWVHVARGGVTVEAGGESNALVAGDAAALEVPELTLRADGDAEVLLFDLG